MIEHTVTIAAAYFSGNSVEPEKIGQVIRDIRQALEGADTNQPAVDPKNSIHDEYLVCLEDGKHLKVLKRYLREVYGLTPEEYREKWGLPDDYPMVCPSYSRQRSSLAKDQGLGVRE